AEQAAGDAEEDGERRRRTHAGDRVTLGDVRHLVRDHAGQLVLAVRDRQQSAGHVDPAAGHREGVGAAVVGHVPLPVDVRPPRGLDQTPADPADVVDELPVTHEPDGALDLLRLLAAELALLLRRDRETATGRDPADHRGELDAALPPRESRDHGSRYQYAMFHTSSSYGFA